MKKVLLTEANEFKYGPGVEKCSDKKFDMPVRNLNVDVPLEEGDIITIPVDYQENILQEVISDATMYVYSIKYK